MPPIPLPPAGGTVYIEASCVIYTVETHPVYGPPLVPLWDEIQAGRLTALSSELTILESLVIPLRTGDAYRQQAFNDLFQNRFQKGHAGVFGL